MPEAQNLTSDGRVRREVVSFVRRGSRLSAAQERAWQAHAAQYVVDVPRGARSTLADPSVRLSVSELYGNANPLIVEIGSGQGDCIAAAAASRPSENFLALEVYKPGLAQTMLHLERLCLPRNVKMLEVDAENSLPTLLGPESIREVWIFFADPWHKTKHHKRRLVSPEFLRALTTLLEPGGIIRTATDWADYAEHQHAAFETVAAEGLLVNLHPSGPRPEGTGSDSVSDAMPNEGFAPRFDGRVRTAFEKKATAAGRLVWEFAYQKA
ncbi:tRNA (guanosine(46)-N7)-methyltransferase TrmB [Dermabacter hominis]|uniref:tRNA (guanosine(46)-N7)-methyltransferase TrmB n=1 Tax=Dermabacter hominis TaxID=36740 RepID=UPI000C78A75F|nr:tRNA (guanosine(46)-N7)-methyltransferase TrmB [Dermabacter hominis]